MVRDFWVENYLSIGERQSIDFRSKTKADYLTCEVAPGVFLNKLGIFLGANASGKSNILFAMQNIFELMNTPKHDINEKITTAPPFVLTSEAPTKMHVSFYVDEVLYSYEVTYFQDYIEQETLYYYPQRSKSLFYKRVYKGHELQADIKFGGSLGLKSNTQRALIENTLNNHSVLSAYRKVALTEDASPFSHLLQWIHDYVHKADEHNGYDVVDELEKVQNSPERHSFYLKMLQKADFNIADFEVKTRTLPKEMLRPFEDGELDDDFKKKLLNRITKRLVFTHVNDKAVFELERQLESRGTIKYIVALDSLYNLITGKHIYLLDELDEGLHYDLLLYFLNVFIYNSDRAQLIFTSQEIALLSEDLLNEHRDLVWFVEKSHTTAASEYTRGDAYGLHKNLSLYKSYKIGRLGAKPELSSFLINLD